MPKEGREARFAVSVPGGAADDEKRTTLAYDISGGVAGSAAFRIGLVGAAAIGAGGPECTLRTAVEEAGEAGEGVDSTVFTRPAFLFSEVFTATGAGGAATLFTKTAFLIQIAPVDCREARGSEVTACTAGSCTATAGDRGGPPGAMAPVAVRGTAAGVGTDCTRR